MLQEKAVKPEKQDISFKPASSLNYESTKAYLNLRGGFKLVSRPKPT